MTGPRSRRTTGCALMVVAALTTASCAAGGGAPSTTTATSAEASVSAASSAASSAAEPVGLIALGHSGLTGENSDPARPHQPAFENSWATGTNPKVASIYERMLARWPQTRDHVVNAAVGGATADTLVDQAMHALATVPTPMLTIIETVDNDVVCPVDALAYPAFASSVDDALRALTKASPHGRIFILLKPDDVVAEFEFDRRSALNDPAALEQMTGPPPCGELDAQHHVQLESARYLADEVDRFNAELVKVCARYATCSTDRGHELGFHVPAGGTNPGNDHLSVIGHAAMAAYFWPFVQEALTSS